MNITRWAAGSLLVMVLVFLASCDVVTPLHKKKPFVSTPVPTDFTVVIDENTDTYYARTHIEQVISAKDLLSRTTYTQFRDYNNTIGAQYTQEHPLTPAQVQAMWEEVERQELLHGAWTWTYFYTESDFYKRDAKVLQIRANGLTKSYKQINHWDGALRDLSLLVQAVRLPLTGGAGTPPTTATAPATREAPAAALVPVPAGTPAVTPAMPNVSIERPTTVPALVPATRP